MKKLSSAQAATDSRSSIVLISVLEAPKLTVNQNNCKRSMHWYLM